MRDVLGLLDPRYGSNGSGGRAIPVLVPSYVARLHNVLEGVQPASRKPKGAPGPGLPPIPRGDPCGKAHKPWQSKNAHVKGKTMAVPKKQASAIIPDARGLPEPQFSRALDRSYGGRSRHCNRPCWSGFTHPVKGQYGTRGAIRWASTTSATASGSTSPATAPFTTTAGIPRTGAAGPPLISTRGGDMGTLSRMEARIGYRKIWRLVALCAHSRRTGGHVPKRIGDYWPGTACERSGGSP